MEHELIFEDEVSVRYLFFPAHRQSNMLLVTFSSFPEVDMLPEYDFVDSLDEFGCNRLHLLDDFGSRGSYYLCENNDYKIERSVVKLIDELCEEHGVVRKIAVGECEGATAAVYYGVKYNFDTVVVGDPHFYIGSYVKELVDANEIFGFMAGNSRPKTVLEFDDVVASVIEGKEVCRTKMIICTRGETLGMHVKHLTRVLDQKLIPYFLDDYNEEFLSKLKVHLAIQGPYASIDDYEIEVAGDVLMLDLTTSSIGDKVALYLYVDGKKVTSTRYSQKRKYYFDLFEEGVYKFKVFIINDFEHRRTISLANIDVSRTSDGEYEGVIVSEEPALSSYELRLERLKSEVDTRFLSSVRDKVDKLPVSNGSRFYNEPMVVRVAVIADRVWFDAYGQVVDSTYVTAENFRESVGKVAVFLVSNAWSGLNGEWTGLADEAGKKREQLGLMIEEFRRGGAKVVFYSEGDPGDYKVFLAVAQLCDFVVTTAQERVASYQKDCGHERVYALRLGVNPVAYNPVGFRKFRKNPGAVFSGGWDKESRYPGSQKDAKMIFDGVRRKNALKLIDENFASEPGDVRYWFPDKYFEDISPALAEEDLRRVYKLFNWAIVINKLRYSSTIASRSVYELQASGNAVLSNYNEGINNSFPNVFTVLEVAEVCPIMSGFTKEELYRHQLIGIRQVMSRETNYERMVEMMNFVGIPVQYPVKKVAVIASALCERVSAMFASQTYEYKELLLQSQITDTVLSDYDFIAFFSAEAQYGMYYLEDMINAFKYVDVDFVTKDAYYIDDELQEGVQHDYVNSFGDKMRTIFSSENYWGLNDLDNCAGCKGYSVDQFEFMVRPSKNEKSSGESQDDGLGHRGAQLTEEERLSNEPPKEREYKLTVVVPVYNNGDHLLNKAFNSLLRSTLFPELEIMIIDDGSTDGITPQIIERLTSSYANVKTYLFPEGGSGSASRPRNKAIEMARADYIAFLDPDDEMINDGLNVLYEAIAGSCYDMVIGESLNVGHAGNVRTKYLRLVKDVNAGSNVVDDTEEFFIKMNFKPKRLQEIIVKRSLVVENELTMVLGALGQDTLFFQEAVLVSEKIKVIGDVVALYYGAVDGSAVNKVSISLFEKYLIREREAVKRFAKHGVLAEFLELRYENFFSLWYFPRLRKVRDDEFVGAVDAMRAIMDVYLPHHTLESDEMIKFYELAVEGNYRALRGIYR